MERGRWKLISEYAEALLKGNYENDLNFKLKLISFLVHLYCLGILTRHAKKKRRTDLKLSVKEALSLISMGLHLPKTPFQAKKRGLPPEFSSWFIVKNLEAMGFVRVHAFNHIEIVTRVEFEGDEK